MGILKFKRSKFFLTLGVCVLFNPALYAAPALLPSAVSPVSPASENRIGIVAAVRGSVQIMQQGQAGKIAGSGQPVFLGDTVSTDGKGSLQILLLDQTIFTIGPNSSIVIDQFVYDPSTDDGVVKAKVVKGIFRFVTGKIGQKKPQQMEVELPSGTIGIRGTIVAGEVIGKKSLVVLLGPGEKNNTGHKEGKFTLSNEFNGQLRQETVAKTGFGSTIESEGAAPTKPFQLPAEQLTRLTSALGPLPVENSQSQGNQAGGQDAEGQTGESGESPTEQSGQGTAVAGESANQLRMVGALVQKLGRESGQAAQRINNDISEIKDGPTSRNQLQAAAQKFGGIYHFEKSNVPLTGAQPGLATFSVDIDFGARRVGGGNSKAIGSIQSGTFQYNLPQHAFGVGTDNASFNFTDVPKAAGSCTANCSFADIDVGVNNKGGIVAADAQVGIRIKNGVGNAQVDAVGSGLAPRVDGASS